MVPTPDHLIIKQSNRLTDQTIFFETKVIHRFINYLLNLFPIAPSLDELVNILHIEEESFASPVMIADGRYLPQGGKIHHISSRP